MLTKIEKTLDLFTEKYPQWDNLIADYFTSDANEPSAEAQKVMDRFGDILKDIVTMAKVSDINVADISKLLRKYTCYKYIEKFLLLKLSAFNDYAPLRKIASEDMYKAKYCADLIWSSYIIRFNPHLAFDENVPMDEETFKAVASCLDQFADRCIRRQFHRSTIIIELEDESGLPRDVCEYIADKIDKDFDQLRLNYIVCRLSACEEAVSNLSAKLSS